MRPGQLDEAALVLGDAVLDLLRAAARLWEADDVDGAERVFRGARRLVGPGELVDVDDDAGQGWEARR